MTTANPSLANRTAHARPTPVAEPVTSATFLSEDMVPHGRDYFFRSKLCSVFPEPTSALSVVSTLYCLGMYCSTKSSPIGPFLPGTARLAWICTLFFPSRTLAVYFPFLIGPASGPTDLSSEVKVMYPSATSWPSYLTVPD